MNLKDSFKNTNLDIESKIPLGGPNVSNAPNMPGGTYTDNRSGNKYGKSPGGPLKDTKGKIIINTINPYGPSNTYLNSFSTPTPLPQIIPSTPLPIEGPVANLINKVPSSDGVVLSLIKSQL
jgi:hypothetical protein